VTRSEVQWIALILDSYQQLFGKPLLDTPMSPAEAVAWLRDQAPFCLLAHDASADQLFVYANTATLRCFGFTHAEFIGMPSRLSAEAPRREERDALLADVARQGFSTGYRGLRIGKQG
jgi:MEKHLA domain